MRPQCAGPDVPRCYTEFSHPDALFRAAPGGVIGHFPGDIVQQFDWQFPHPSRRAPVIAGNVVATSQPLAAQAGLQIMARGGNAVDAAIATAIALAVTEPCSNGIGSDLFAQVWDGTRLHGLNASGRAPAAWNPARFAGMKKMPMTGWDAVTVPGAVSGWVALSKRFGRLPFADLFEPAIRYARDGYPVAPGTSRKWKKRGPILSAVPGFAEGFMRLGHAPEAGERFSFPEQARTLELIAASHGSEFYEGGLAGAMCAHAKAHGGAMTVADLASHAADWVEPLAVEYCGHTLHELPPNGQGLVALMALGILQRRDFGSVAPASPDYYHLMIEALKLAFADVHRHVADPASMKIDPASLLEDSHLAECAASIDMKRAGDYGRDRPRPGGTVYLCTADSEGRMVSLIQSNFKDFGSGVVVPGTGISLHSRGLGFSLEPGHPNLVAGGKRPFHTIIPGFVTRAGQPLMALGIVGAEMQPQGHVQILARVINGLENPQSALDAPRFRFLGGLDVAFEEGIPGEVRTELAARGHRVVDSGGPAGTEKLTREQDVVASARSNFGGAQIIYRLPDAYVAASDPRKDGQAVGY